MCVHTSLQMSSAEIKADLRDLHIVGAKQVELAGGKKAIIIFVPYRYVFSIMVCTVLSVSFRRHIISCPDAPRMKSSVLYFVKGVSAVRADSIDATRQIT
jgi:hypothetical protein